VNILFIDGYPYIPRTLFKKLNIYHGIAKIEYGPEREDNTPESGYFFIGKRIGGFTYIGAPGYLVCRHGRTGLKSTGCKGSPANQVFHRNAE